MIFLAFSAFRIPYAALTAVLTAAFAFIPYVGAANLRSHSCSFVGMGRQSFAYPDSIYDDLSHASIKNEPKRNAEVTLSHSGTVLNAV